MTTKDIIKLYNRIIARKLPPINPDKYKGSKKAILDKITAEVGDIPLDQLRATYYPDHAAALQDIEQKMAPMQLPAKRNLEPVDAAAIQKYLEEHPTTKAAIKAKPVKAQAAPKAQAAGNSSAVEAAAILGIPATKLRAKLRKLGMNAPYPDAQEIIKRVQ
jgi:DNA-binding NtrC family response regulator